MTCQEVYHIALSLLGEEEGRGDTADLRARFLPLLNAFCFDKGGRETVRIEGEEELFPLEESYAYPCAFFAASMLVADENEPLASALLEQSDRLSAGIRRETAERVERIRDRYASLS